jgi:hypothetical protein
MVRAAIPQPQPRPPALSLLGAALTPDQLTEVGAVGQRWQNGWAFQPEACTGGWVEDPCDPEPRITDDRPGFIEGEPFAVVVPDRCSTKGFLAADYEARARRLLLRKQSKLIAAELWDGDLAAAAGWPNQTLIGAAEVPGGAAEPPDVLTNGAASALGSLACLEQYLAECSGDRGMIHCTPQLATTWAALGHVLRREGALLLTALDTIVVPDAGYPGSGPGGTPASTSQWAYATGMVTVELSPVEITPPTMAEAVDRATNTVEFYAQRLAAVMWDGCCHGAAEVDLPVCLVGGAS